VAALDDGHPRPHGIAVAHHAQWKRHVLVGIDIDAPAPGLTRLVDERRQPLQALRADDDIDGDTAFEEAFAFLLRHAAGYREQGRAAGLARRVPDFAQAR